MLRCIDYVLEGFKVCRVSTVFDHKSFLSEMTLDLGKRCFAGLSVLLTGMAEIVPNTCG